MEQDLSRRRFLKGAAISAAAAGLVACGPKTPPPTPTAESPEVNTALILVQVVATNYQLTLQNLPLYKRKLKKAQMVANMMWL